VRFETKLAVVVREDLAAWQKLNVTAFLVSGFAATVPGITGEPYRDGSGEAYQPMFVQPVLVFGTDAPGLRRAFERSRERGLTPAVYTAELFATGHDEANRAAVAAVPTTELDLVGIAVHGERRVVDAALRGLSFHA
jgi:hypothetical protein